MNNVIPLFGKQEHNDQQSEVVISLFARVNEVGKGVQALNLAEAAVGGHTQAVRPMPVEAPTPIDITPSIDPITSRKAYLASLAQNAYNEAAQQTIIVDNRLDDLNKGDLGKVA